MIFIFTGTLKCIVKFQNETGITSVDIVVYALRLVANPATLVKGTGTEVSCEIISNITNQLNTTFRIFGNGIYGKCYNWSKFNVYEKILIIV